MTFVCTMSYTCYSSLYTLYTNIHCICMHIITISIIAGHKCEQPGCGWALVFDGNLKIHRDVCFAANAGYAEFKGLNGQVRIGCQDNPSFKSRYCELHKPKAPAIARTRAEGTAHR